jgi:hypothetical protein
MGDTGCSEEDARSDSRMSLAAAARESRPRDLAMRSLRGDGGGRAASFWPEENAGSMSSVLPVCERRGDAGCECCPPLPLCCSRLP